MFFPYEYTLFKKYQDRQYRFNQFFISDFSKELTISKLSLQVDLKQFFGSSEDFAEINSADLDNIMKNYDFATLVTFGYRGSWSSTRDIQAELDLKIKKNYKLRKKRLNFLYSTFIFMNTKWIDFILNNISFNSKTIINYQNNSFLTDFFFIQSSSLLNISDKFQTEILKHQSIFQKFYINKKLNNENLTLHNNNNNLYITLNVPVNSFQSIRNLNKYWQFHYNKYYHYKVFINFKNFSPMIFGTLFNKTQFKFYWLKIILQGFNIITFDKTRKIRQTKKID